MKQSAQSNQSRSHLIQGQGEIEIARKRTLENESTNRNEGDEDENENENVSKRFRSGSSDSEQILKWYACPFNKHDPKYFSSNKETRMRFKTCSSKGWTEICRLKEHLYRVHQDTPKCDRCQKVFLHKDDLKAHSRDQVSTDCKWMPEIPSRGISPEIILELRKRPKFNLTDKEKWFKIWRLLFPNETLPDSPFSNLCETPNLHGNGAFHEYLDLWLPKLFETKLGAALHGIGLTVKQQKTVKKVSIKLESSLRKDLWESYIAGSIGDNNPPSAGSDKEGSTESESISIQSEGFFGFEFDPDTFVFNPQSELEPTSYSEHHTTKDSDYYTNELYQSQSLEDKIPFGRLSHDCTTQPSTSARQSSWSNKEYELTPERPSSPFLNAGFNCIDPTYLLSPSVANLHCSRQNFG